MAISVIRSGIGGQGKNADKHFAAVNPESQARSEQAGQGSKEMDKKRDEIAHRRIVAGREIPRKYGVCGELIRGRYYPQIAPRKGDASPLLNGPGDSETIGVAQRTATKSAKSA
ncbi:MAG: hypothetical protein DMG42_26860 [Acidobacteria bacterium]|nr:MAG: hypothetical protein DMG42_26860 [Acidobacteriota bacterium]